jgi:type II secretory pathway component PulF
VARLQILLMPSLVGVLGLVVLWIVWAVFDPLYALLTQIRI